MDHVASLQKMNSGSKSILEYTRTIHQLSIRDTTICRGFMNDVDLVEKFGLLINKCKHAIPLIRIVQKSVRTVVCQELTNVIDHVVLKNDIFAWLRLWSFPFIVLNMISKGNHRQNFIRHNLVTFSKIIDIQVIFRD